MGTPSKCVSTASNRVIFSTLFGIDAWKSPYTAAHAFVRVPFMILEFFWQAPPRPPLLHFGPPQRGFTLIELVMVMILVGILAVYVAPSFMRFNAFGDAGFRDQMQSSLQMARKYAIAHRRNVRVTLSGSALSFTADLAADDAAAAGTFTALNMSAGSGQCGANQVCATGASLTVTGPAQLTFSPLGQVSGSSFQYTISDSTASYSATLTVDAQTGYVY